MKITTADCVKAIIKYFYEKDEENLSLMTSSKWKRRSKSGTGDNIVRVFENSVTGTIMNVHSSETTIFKVVEGKPKIENIKSFLRDALKEMDFYDLPYELLGENNVVNWPQISMKDFPEDPEEEAFDEPLDMENFEWLSITDDELIVACGGDWQEPLTLTIKLINGKLTVTHTEEGYEEGMNEETFIKTLQQ